jgi:ABC-type uncharacterized transport system ATPase subunit
MILDKGRLILDDTFDSMRKKYCRQRVLRLTLASPLRDGQLKQIEGIELMPVSDRWNVKMRFDPAAGSTMALMHQLQQVLDIVDLTVEDLPIDEFVARIYETQGSDGGDD